MIDPLSDRFWGGFSELEGTLLDCYPHISVPAGGERRQVLPSPDAFDLPDEIVPGNRDLPLKQGVSEILGVLVLKCSGDVVLSPLACVLLSSGLRIKDIRELEKAAELLGISLPRFSLLLGLMSCLQLCHRLGCSTVSNLDVSSPQRTHHTLAPQMELNAIHSVRPLLDRLPRSPHGFSTARVLRQRTARES